MDTLQSELAVSPPIAQRARSPPLAFVPTSNDALFPLRSPSVAESHRDHSRVHSPSLSAMGLTSPQEQDLQVIVDQQANAIQLLHEAFAAERQVWSLEKDRLYQRIASLEQLLKTRDHYSPAKSPVLSPYSGSNMTSPPSRTNGIVPRLPMIAEDENIQPLSQRRSGAPQSIDLPGRPPASSSGERVSRSQRGSGVSFQPEPKVDENPLSPPTAAKTLSPVPPENRSMAGHTPLKAKRPPTPPPKDMLLDGVEDTPTRHNTHINAFLTRSNNDDVDMALKGPLNMPELPNRPDESNFTLEALSKRLEQIEKDPEVAKPMIFSEPSLGLASPASPPLENLRSPERADKFGGQIGSAVVPDGYISHSDLSSNNLSPTAALSPNGAPQSQKQSHEEQVHRNFEEGGIKLKKKPSVNFGAPFGSLGGLGGMRKMS